MTALTTNNTTLVSDIDRYEQVISLAYQCYSSQGTIDEKTFALATQAFSQLESLYQELRNTPSALTLTNPSVLIIPDNLATMRKYINAMHASIPHPTARDLQLFQSFFQKSPEKYYTCPDGIQYHQPDHSHLLNIASALFGIDEYASMGLSKFQHLLHPITKKLCPCSVLRIRKHQDQPDLFASYSQNHTPKQARLFSKLIETLPRLVREWDYDCYYPCRGTESANFGFSAQDPENLYTIFFFYRECNAPQREVDYTQRVKELSKPIKPKEAVKKQTLLLKAFLLCLCIKKVLSVFWNKLMRRGAI